MDYFMELYRAGPGSHRPNTGCVVAVNKSKVQIVELLHVNRTMLEVDLWLLVYEHSTPLVMFSTIPLSTLSVPWMYSRYTWRYASYTLKATSIPHVFVSMTHRRRLKWNPLGCKMGNGQMYDWQIHTIALDTTQDECSANKTLPAKKEGKAN